jgi:PhoH-like ATPase
MKKTILIDTNLLLDDANVIYKLSKEYEKILLPLTVLKELDDKKYNPDLSYSARNAIHVISQFKEEYPDKIIFHIGPDEITGPDARIICAAEETGADLATKDMSMSIQANAKGINTKIYDVVLNNIFNPYVYINHEKLYVEEDVFAYGQKYAGDNYEDILKLFSKAAGKELNRNAWFFVFLNIETDKPIIYANNPTKHIFDRIDNNQLYLEIKLGGGIVIKVRDSYQNCALYALQEAPHCLITGKYGTGKTLLSVAHTLAYGYRKSFITRPPIGLDRRYDLGFMPGPKEDKMMDWLAGFLSALYYIYGNSRGQTKDGISYDHIKDVMFRESFEILPINAMQGLSLLDKDILLVDEIQLISIAYVSMILSRPSETGKLILMGDVGQTYGIVKPSESGLLKLLRVLPHRSLAYVELQNSYRSDILEIADKLQDKTIG